jgi:hypothetical protein
MLLSAERLRSMIRCAGQISQPMPAQIFISQKCKIAWSSNSQVVAKNIRLGS